ncbi:Gfo/Idh/MocA family oxidoreductase [Paenibacillus sp. ATY16]|uniref:Gfo/Idh/MocA family protein n=1 Tax=Paenibacillus sp. ATY16 TaxID=1759312 RepID=UPI00200C9C21|nr:Gfo/Idh/MocA family oxidoreductase [Paenibacillus sp. ATY16]MCK9858660.1 Gfo/Idh/MocA family oxidoreductase [Paenibacillus sp. ATY16]
MASGKLKVAVLGLHNHYHIYPMARYIAQGDIPDIEWAGVYDERTLQAEKFARDYGLTECYPTREALFADPDVDAVLVMSDTGAHERDVLDCAKHGKHVLLDKPISITTDQAERMVRAADKANIVLMMAYLIRYLPPYIKARQLIEQGVIGKPLTMKISIRCPLYFITDSPDVSEPGWYVDPKRGGYGGFNDHGIHYTDIMRYLLGSEPASVIGQVAKLKHKDLEVDDYGVCIVTMDGGEIVTIESTWHAPGWYTPMISQEECTIVGTEGEIQIHYQKSPQLEVSGNGIQGRDYFDWQGDDRYEVCYRECLLDFVKVVRGDKPLSVSGNDGLQALRVIEGAYRSSETGRLVHLTEVSEGAKL